MRLNRYEGQAHYSEHVDPVWDALPPQLRGESWVLSARQSGQPWLPGFSKKHPGPLLVASYRDAVGGAGRGRDLVYLEHGAGQTYHGDRLGADARGWAGSPGLDRVRLFLCPSERVAARWRSVYGAPAVAVGCPKLDRLAMIPAPAEPAVAVTFHWDCPLVPESRSAFGYYDRALPALAAWCRRSGVRLLGHGHPRMWSRIEKRWAQLGVEPVRDFAEVVARASVLVADNTSAMYEWAALDRPVVVLNAPFYRRDVEHGLRFWSAVPGRMVDDRADLVAAVARAVSDPGDGADLRRRARAAAYAAVDGGAADRAARAIMETLR